MYDPIISASAALAVSPAVWLDCRPDDAAYQQGHVEHAIHVHLDRDLAAAKDPASGGRHPLPAVDVFATKVGQWGIGPNTRVFAYDDQNGANAASRLWWMLRAIGHRDVQIIDGGLKALIAEGAHVVAERPSPPAVGAYPVAAYLLPTASVDDVETLRERRDARVLDVRAAFRYRGESEPIDPVAGHIPGAVNLPFAENLRADGTFKSAAELRTQYLALLGDLQPDALIVQCGSGVTACHTLVALERAGLRQAKLYVGSWSEWCRQPRPRATGKS